MNTPAPSLSKGWRALTLIALVFGIGALACAIGLDTAEGDWTESGEWIPFCLSFIGVGTIILFRSSSTRIGWLFLMVGCTVAASLLLSSYANFAVSRALPGAAWAAVGFTLTIWLSVLVFLVIQLFPDGRPLSSAWLPLSIATVVVVLVGLVSSGLSEQEDFSGNFPSLTHPAQLIPEPIARMMFASAQFASLLIVALSAICLASRFRRSRGRARQQLKWLAVAAGLVAGAFIACAAWPQVAQPVVAFQLLMPLVPLACGIAIVRFDLYDIDRIIGRTTAYAMVTGVLLAVYAVVVTSLTSLVPESGSTGQADSWAVAVATLVAAGLFRPVLRWSRRVVDRRFNREQFDAERCVEAFAVRLRDEVEGDEVRSDLLTVLGSTVQPASAGLWLSEPAP